MLSLQVAVLALAAAGAPDTVLYDFYGDYCQPCRQMEPTIQRLLQLGYPVKKVNCSQQPALAQQFRVQSVPCFVLVSGGREVERVTGATSFGRLEEMFRRVGVSPRDENYARSRGQSPDRPATVAPSSSAIAASGSMPGPRGKTFAPSNDAFALNAPTGDPRAPTDPRAPITAFPPRNTGAGTSGAAATGAGSKGVVPAAMGSTDGGSAAFGSPGTSSNAGSIESATDAFVRATVRIKVDDPTGHSYGTGTIVDARNGDALILTCGHLFRDSKGKGRVTVDLFIPGAPRSIPGKLVQYDLDSDLGLISIRPGMALKAIPIAPAEYQISPGSKVVNVGCSNGNDPTARSSNVTTVDRYLGGPNVQISGRPVVGRSGGGVFSSEGYLIGVCFAADPSADEGLYRAHKAVHTLLDRNNLAYVYRQPSATAVAIGNGSAGNRGHAPAAPDAIVSARSNDPFAGAPSAISNAAPIDADSLPEMTGEPMPVGRMQPTSVPPSRAFARSDSRDAPAGGAAAGNLTRSEEALLDEIRGRSDSAEVICILRTPGAKSEILVLDRASPALLEQLQAQRRVSGTSGAANTATMNVPGPNDIMSSGSATEVPVPTGSTNAASINGSSMNASSMNVVPPSNNSMNGSPNNGPLFRSGPSWAKSARAVTR